MYVREKTSFTANHIGFAFLLARAAAFSIRLSAYLCLATRMAEMQSLTFARSSLCAMPKTLVNDSHSECQTRIEIKKRNRFIVFSSEIEP